MGRTMQDGSNVLLANSVPLPLVYAALAAAALLYLGIVSQRTVGIGVSLFLAVIALIVFYQENILYIPVIQGWKTPGDNPAGYQTPSQIGLRYEDVTFKAADGTKLHGWFIPAPESVPQPAPTLLFCHENAGNIGLRIPEYGKVNKLLRVNQFVFDYRGFGYSEGSPSEAGLVRDAVAAFRYLAHPRRAPLVSPARGIVLCGRSLGGAVAVAAMAQLEADFAAAVADAAQRGDASLAQQQAAGGAAAGGAAAAAAYSPAALIVENSFTSISDMVDAKFPLLNIPFFKELFLRLEWRTLHTLPRVAHRPLLFLASTRDEIVPPAQMEALRDAAAAANAHARGKAAAAAAAAARAAGSGGAPEEEEEEETPPSSPTYGGGVSGGNGGGRGGGRRGVGGGALRKVHPPEFHAFDATHNDIWMAGGAPYWEAKAAFVRKHCS